MSKVVNCRDLGFDCEGVVRAETDEEALEFLKLMGFPFAESK